MPSFEPILRARRHFHIWHINVFHNTISLYIAVPKNHSMMSYTNYSAPNKFSKLIHKTQIAHFVMGDKGHSD